VPPHPDHPALYGGVEQDAGRSTDHARPARIDFALTVTTCLAAGHSGRCYCRAFPSSIKRRHPRAYYRDR
jgi:hypothetical protein